MAKSKEPFEIKVELASSPDTTNMSKMTEEDVDVLLSRLPRTKLEQKQKVMNSMLEKDKCTEEYKKQLSIARLYASSNKDELGLGSDKDREAWAANKYEVIAAKKEELNAILKVKWQESIFEYFDDLFIAARKLANKFEIQLKNDMENARYGRH